jgi:hypothetical protein
VVSLALQRLPVAVLARCTRNFEIGSKCATNFLAEALVKRYEPVATGPNYYWPGMGFVKPRWSTAMMRSFLQAQRKS